MLGREGGEKEEFDGRSDRRVVQFFHTMQSLKAHARNGRLLLDEPTDLPDGAEVQLMIIDGDELDDEERAALHASIEAAERELDEGQGASQEDLWARLRAIG